MTRQSVNSPKDASDARALLGLMFLLPRMTVNEYGYLLFWLRRPLFTR